MDRAHAPLRGGLAGRERHRRRNRVETFLDRHPCGAGVTHPSNGLLLALATGRPHTVRWQRDLGGSETSPRIVGKRLFIGTAQGDVYCLDAADGKTIWHYHVDAPVKGGIAYDRGQVFFGATTAISTPSAPARGSSHWTASSARDFTGGHGAFYSTPAVAYSRVHLGSTDGKVYAFDEWTGHLVRAHATGSYVYGSPAVSDGRVFIGSYDRTFYALNAATGNTIWTYAAGEPISGSATVVDGLVYFATLHARQTFGLDALTGRRVWEFNDGAFGAIVTDGSRLYVAGGEDLRVQPAALVALLQQRGACRGADPGRDACNAPVLRSKRLSRPARSSGLVVSCEP